MHSSSLTRFLRGPRHFAGLLWSVVCYSAVNRRVWPIVIFALILSIAFLTAATYTVTPFMYTLF